MKPSNENDRLAELLRTWRVEPSRSAGFKSGVWRKIDAHRPAGSWKALFRGHPAAIACLLLFAMIAGGFGGAELARVRVDRQSTAMADSYVKSLDARQMTMP